MKTLKISIYSLLLGSALLSAPQTAKANNPDSLSVNVALAELTKNRHLLAFQKPENEKVYLRVYGKTGVLLYKKTIGKAKDAHIHLDMSELPFGAYKIVLKGQDGQTLFENVLSVN
jgi:hypothetical protein